MEFNKNPHHEPKSSGSDEESDDHRSEQAGRSYECVFCKRGFTTAQALGGHMNIHRKDGAKNYRPTVNPSFSIHKVGDDHDNYSSCKSYMPGVHTTPEVHVSYSSFFPTITSSRSEKPHHTVCDRDSRCDSLNRRNSYHYNYPSGVNLTLGAGSSSATCVNGDDDDNKEKREDNSEGEDEIDLELRLGHDP